jgi:hypothetical protein
MRLRRFLPLLVLCCALDLAVPIAPAANGGVEFEEDEEVIHLGARPVAEKATADARQPQGSLRRSLPPSAARLAALARRPRPTWRAEAIRTPQSRADAAGAARPTAEDH